MEIDGGPSSASAALQSAYDALRAAAASLREPGSTQEGARAGRGALFSLPELFFVNVRKGSFDARSLAPPGER